MSKFLTESKTRGNIKKVTTSIRPSFPPPPVGKSKALGLSKCEDQGCPAHYAGPGEEDGSWAEGWEERSGLKSCKSPYCECDTGKCTYPGFYDARGEHEQVPTVVDSR